MAEFQEICERVSVECPTSSDFLAADHRCHDSVYLPRWLDRNAEVADAIPVLPDPTARPRTRTLSGQGYSLWTAEGGHASSSYPKRELEEEATPHTKSKEADVAFVDERPEGKGTAAAAAATITIGGGPEGDDELRYSDGDDSSVDIIYRHENEAAVSDASLFTAINNVTCTRIVPPNDHAANNSCGLAGDILQSRGDVDGSGGGEESDKHHRSAGSENHIQNKDLVPRDGDGTRLDRSRHLRTSSEQQRRRAFKPATGEECRDGESGCDASRKLRQHSAIGPTAEVGDGTALIEDGRPKEVPDSFIRHGNHTMIDARLADEQATRAADDILGGDDDSSSGRADKIVAVVEDVERDRDMRGWAATETSVFENKGGATARAVGAVGLLAIAYGTSSPTRFDGTEGSLHSLDETPVATRGSAAVDAAGRSLSWSVASSFETTPLKGEFIGDSTLTSPHSAFAGISAFASRVDYYSGVCPSPNAASRDDAVLLTAVGLEEKGPGKGGKGPKAGYDAEGLEDSAARDIEITLASNHGSGSTSSSEVVRDTVELLVGNGPGSNAPAFATSAIKGYDFPHNTLESDPAPGPFDGCEERFGGEQPGPHVPLKLETVIRTATAAAAGTDTDTAANESHVLFAVKGTNGLETKEHNQHAGGTDLTANVEAIASGQHFDGEAKGAGGGGGGNGAETERLPLSIALTSAHDFRLPAMGKDRDGPQGVNHQEWPVQASPPKAAQIDDDDKSGTCLPHIHDREAVEGGALAVMNTVAVTEKTVAELEEELRWIWSALDSRLQVRLLFHVRIVALARKRPIPFGDVARPHCNIS